MPSRVELPPFHPARPHLVRPVRVDPSGRDGPTPKQARGPHWRRTSRGLYVPATVQRSLEQRIVEAAAVLPDGGAVTGWAALRWQGGHWFDGLDRTGGERPVVLASCAQDITPQAGLVPCEERLNPAEILVVDGLNVVVPARAVFFEMRYAPTFVDAVVAMDMAAFADL
ncbi:MAG: hypothetical protein JOZ82_05685, partial [Marmoricola sp.]|nr:hypothetical protein [Marmoricola sp.]